MSTPSLPQIIARVLELSSAKPETPDEATAWLIEISAPVCMFARALEDAMAREEQAKPWLMFYRDGKTLGTVAAECGGTIYHYSPWLISGVYHGSREAGGVIADLKARLKVAEDALDIADGLFDQMALIRWDEDSSWQHSSYEGIADDCRDALAAIRKEGL